MITYNDCLKEVGYYKLGDVPAATVEYLAYKNGETDTEARMFSNLVEQVNTNNDEINTYWSKRMLLEHKGIKLFERLVKDEIAPDFLEDIWDLCWSAAYKRSHSSGYDEVANSAKHYVDFANDVLMIHTDSGKKMNMLCDSELKTIYKQRDNIVSPKY